MLPEKLSTDLTSLGEGQDRLAIVVEMVIAEDGAILSSTLFRALVRNRAKLAYNNIAAWFAGEVPMPDRVKAVSGLDAQLRLQDQVAQRLKVRRHQQGALSLETIEPRAVFEGEVLTDLRVEQKNRAKELIEDFMIAANQATASYLNGKGMPSFRRILRSPERWQRIVEVAARWDGHLPSEPDAGALESFLIVSALKQGKTLCRLGFPFPEFNNFAYYPDIDQISWTNTGKEGTPRFPIEGMLTRLVADDGGKIIAFELSTPGIRGQSGGPAFDAEGRVWGMQSLTKHLDLDFDVDVEVQRGAAKRRVKDSAFLHVGGCIHIDALKAFMRDNSVKFEEG